MDLGANFHGHPRYLWIGAGVAGLGLAYVWSRNRSSAAPGAEEPTSADGGGLLPQLPRMAGGTILGGPGGIGNEDGQDTNSEWQMRAISGLIAAGVDPVLADSAVRKYLLGLPVSAAEAAIVGRALVAQGPPPEGTSPLEVSTPGGPSATTPELDPPEAPPSTPYGDPSGTSYTYLPSTTGALVPIPSALETIQVEGRTYDLDFPGTIPALNPIIVENLKPGDSAGAARGTADVGAPPQAPTSWDQAYESWVSAGAHGTFHF